jgi:hypothetical protein
MLCLDEIESSLVPYQNKLRDHSLYSTLESIEDIKVFMSMHVFSVWDFMSLLKSLQNALAPTTVPWLPPLSSSSARFINEIVLGEESDHNELGEIKSHFEMYLDAMHQMGADTKIILSFLDLLQKGHSVSQALDMSDLDKRLKEYVAFSFSMIRTKKTHVIASAFTFGREKIIPTLFIEILNQVDSSHYQKDKMQYYLERHIELDGDEHGPMALKMLEDLCQGDAQQQKEVLDTAILALQHRIALWDSIESHILIEKSKRPHLV